MERHLTAKPPISLLMAIPDQDDAAPDIRQRPGRSAEQGERENAADKESFDWPFTVLRSARRVRRQLTDIRAP
jgi:hypothetical protein